MSDIFTFSPLWGEWYIRELIGKGTFGAVYRAEKTEYGNTYTSAVKHISIPNDNVNAESLISEGVVSDERSVLGYYDSVRDKIISEINFCYELRGNTNIVSYEDHCIIPKTDGAGYDIFIRMEYLAALPKYMRENSFGETDIARLGVDICSALEVLDRHSIIHRDIKPANIFVNSMGVYKLGDFGESKVLTNTNMGMTVRGTYTYMSPEISMGRNADITADIYSLGIVMYRLLNGNKAPFVPTDIPTVDAQTVETANVRRFRGEKLPLPLYCKDRGLAAIIMKACEYSPSDRWQKPADMRRALESLLEGTFSGIPGQSYGSGEPTSTAPTMTVPPQYGENGRQDVSSMKTSDGNKKKSKLRIIIPIFAALILGAGVLTILVLSRPPQKGGSSEGDNASVTENSGSPDASGQISVQPSYDPDRSESSTDTSGMGENSRVGEISTDESSYIESSAGGSGSDESSSGESGADESSTGESSSDESSAGESSVTESAGVVSLTLTSMPLKLTYLPGESFEPDGLRLEAAYEDGTKKEIQASECTFSGFDSSAVGTINVTVGFGGKQTVIELTVVEDSQYIMTGSCGKGASFTLDRSGVLTISGNGDIDDHTLGYVILDNGSVGVECSVPWSEWSGLIEKVVIGNGITRIGTYCFYDCPALKSVTLPDSVKTIGASAFRGCITLQSFHLPAGIEDIEDEAFINCLALSSFTVDARNKTFSAQDGMLFSKDKTELIMCPEAKKGSVELPYGLKTIDNWAFDGCSGITGISLPSTVSTIGGYAFSGCTGINKITVGKNVGMIGRAAFRSWKESQTIEFTGITAQPDTWDKAWNSECGANILWDGAFG